MIKIDMEMPEYCGKCVFNRWNEFPNGYYCLLTENSVELFEKDDDCPLIEVKE